MLLALRLTGTIQSGGVTLFPAPRQMKDRELLPFLKLLSEAFQAQFANERRTPRWKMIVLTEGRLMTSPEGRCRLRSHTQESIMKDNGDADVSLGTLVGQLNEV